VAIPLLTKLPQLFGKLGSGAMRAGTPVGRAAMHGARGAGKSAAWLGWGGKKGREFMGPEWMFPGMLLGGSFVAEEIASPLGKGIWGTSGNPLNRLTGGSPDQLALTNMKKEQSLELQMQLASIEQNIKRQQLERSTAQNAARLAATAPHLYNQILAGRQLPQGAVVLGGQPRTDLLEQLSYGMATGQFQESPMGAQDDFLSSLGV